MKLPHNKHRIPAWVWVALSAVISALLFSMLLVVNASVSSVSMEPTVRAGRQVLGWRPAYRLTDPARGDIVLFTHPSVSGLLLLKRVIAVGGDVVEIRNGVVFINGSATDEPYAVRDTSRNVAPVTVPAGCCYLLGDNRAASNDSSRWANAFVPYAALVAKVIWIYG